MRGGGPGLALLVLTIPVVLVVAIWQLAGPFDASLVTVDMLLGFLIIRVEGLRGTTVPGSLERAAASALWRRVRLGQILWRATCLVLGVAGVSQIPVYWTILLLFALVDAWKDDDGWPWLRDKVSGWVDQLVQRPDAAPNQA